MPGNLDQKRGLVSKTFVARVTAALQQKWIMCNRLCASSRVRVQPAIALKKAGNFVDTKSALAGEIVAGSRYVMEDVT